MSSTFDTAKFSLLEATFFIHPPEAMKDWLVALTVLHFYVACTAISVLVLTCLENHRTGSKCWLWRTVERSSGSYIAGNLLPFTYCMGLITSSVYVIRFTYEYYFYWRGGTEKYLVLLRFAPCLFVFATGWCVSWAALQSFVLVCEALRQDRLRWWNPVVGNVAFLVLGVAGAGFIFSVWVYDSVTWIRACGLLEGSGGQITVSDLLSDSPVAKRLHYLLSRNFGASKVLLISSAVSEYINCLFSFSTIPLAYLINLHTIPAIRTDVPTIEVNFDEPTLQNRVPKSPTVSLVEIAGFGSVEGLKRRSMLQRAKREVILVGVISGVMSGLLACIFVWYLIPPTKTSAGASWKATRVSLYLHGWIHAVVFGILLTVLNINAFMHLSPPKAPGAAQTMTRDPMASQGAEMSGLGSTASFGGFLAMEPHRASDVEAQARAAEAC